VELDLDRTFMKGLEVFRNFVEPTELPVTCFGWTIGGDSMATTFYKGFLIDGL